MPRKPPPQILPPVVYVPRRINKNRQLFSTEQAQRICNFIKSGLTLRQTAQKEGISEALIIHNRHRDPIFQKQYAEALEYRTEREFEGLLAECETPERTDKGIDMAWVQWQRLRIDTMKWALSKRNPKKYGEKMQLEHGLESSLADRLDSARKRLESGD